ncbi:DinB family protein [Blastococcus sp. TF02A-26]|uniref:DinB family protein n=1 Tax=Blastococcus sp. TF02A-26 TaxID=2250577 RepID=UPI000DEBEA6A|nr:DinB family protein [Blastococcus sp. TF02A-26]RBY85328.1 mini-circle protein [Blastococcus sp. TF02A-26]
MTPPRVRPAYAADERTQLLGWLDLQRALVPWKCAGLTEEQASLAVLPSSPQMSVAGLVSHLRWTEHCWFEVLFLGWPATDNPQFDESRPGADMRVDGVPLARLLEEYETQCACAREIVASHSLDDTCRNSEYAPGVTLRWVLLHMLEETARHVGHLDAMRELIDGRTGYY